MLILTWPPTLEWVGDINEHPLNTLVPQHNLPQPIQLKYYTKVLRYNRNDDKIMTSLSVNETKEVDYVAL